MGESSQKREQALAARHQEFIAKEHHVVPNQNAKTDHFYQKFARLSWKKKALILGLVIGSGVALAFLLRNTPVIPESARSTVPARSTHKNRVASRPQFFEEEAPESSSALSSKARRRSTKQIAQEKMVGDQAQWGRLLHQGLQYFLESMPPDLQRIMVDLLQQKNFAGFFMGVDALEGGVSLESPAYAYCLPNGQMAISVAPGIIRGMPNPTIDFAKVIGHEIIHLFYCHDLALSPFFGIDLGTQSASSYLSTKVGEALSNDTIYRKLAAYFEDHPYFPAVFKATAVLDQDQLATVQGASVRMPEHVLMPGQKYGWYVTDVQVVSSQDQDEAASAILTHTVVNPTTSLDRAQTRIDALISDLKFLFYRSKTLRGDAEHKDAELFINFLQMTGFEVAEMIDPKLMKAFREQVTAEQASRLVL